MDERRLHSRHATEVTLEVFRNEDGKTFNGAAMLAWLSGVSEVEVLWTWRRLQVLIPQMGREGALSQLKKEREDRPWLNNPT